MIDGLFLEPGSWRCQPVLERWRSTMWCTDLFRCISTCQVNTRSSTTGTRWSVNPKGANYEALMIHFLTIDVDWSSFPLELHVVHFSKSGKIAVIAWLFNHGKASDFLAQVRTLNSWSDCCIFIVTVEWYDARLIVAVRRQATVPQNARCANPDRRHQASEAGAELWPIPGLAHHAALFAESHLDCHAVERKSRFGNVLMRSSFLYKISLISLLYMLMEWCIAQFPTVSEDQLRKLKVAMPVSSSPILSLIHKCDNFLRIDVNFPIVR